ncbi:MAG: hypothetical protein ACK5FX_11690 [Flavobacteriia bacterium]|jgi:hypothetical protein
MFARYFFIALGIASLLWVGYVAADLIDKRNAFAPTSLFGKEDGKVLIINRLNEADEALLPFKTIPKNHEVLNALKPHIKEIKAVFISASRRHLMIETKFFWDKNKVNNLLKKSGLKFKSTGLNSFEISGYQIEYHKNALYLHAPDLESTTSDAWSNFDRKSSASLIDFSTDTPSVLEVYFRQKGKVEFITKNLKGLKGKHANDKEIFAAGLPKNLEKYHFFEKEFAAYNDQTFANGPMYEWIENGYVSFEYKGEKAIVTDYINGQSPIALLNETLKTDAEEEEHAQFKGIELFSGFPSSLQEGFHVYLMDDFAVIAENESVCSEIVAQHKLGNTLSSEQYAMDKIYADLPSRVSERVAEGESRFSKTVYKNKLLETHLGNVIHQTVAQPEEEIKQDDETITMNIDANIKDFIAFNGKGNCVVLTVTGELMSYSGGKMNWVKNLNNKTIGGITYIEEYQMILVTAKNALHLLDKNGKYVTGGPVSIGGRTPQQPATEFNYKGRMYLAYPDMSGNVVVYDSRRKKISSFPHGLSEVTGPVEIWVSQEKLFFGILNKSAFVMLEAEKKKEYRSFALPGESISTISDNELFLLTSEGGKLSCVNQKGIKIDIRNSSKGKMLSSDKGRKESYLSNFNRGQVFFYGTEGTFIGKVNTDVNDAEYWAIQTIDGKSYVSIVDGIENNVYLYELDGGKVVDRSFEGGKKCMLSRSQDELILTTIVDRYIVQYRLKK